MEQMETCQKAQGPILATSDSSNGKVLSQRSSILTIAWLFRDFSVQKYSRRTREEV